MALAFSAKAVKYTGVLAAHHLGLAARGELCAGELAHCLQHDITGIVGACGRHAVALQQTLIHQRRQSLQCVARLPVHKQQRQRPGTAPHKDAETGKEDLVGLGEQAIAPGNGVAQGLLPRR